MTTTITPTLGAAPLFTQGGTGAAPGYSAIDLRRMLACAPLRGGVLDTGLIADEFKVIQRVLGANMSVDLQMRPSGMALVANSLAFGNGMYAVTVPGIGISDVSNEVISAAHATLPRIDRVYLRVWDTAVDASGLNRAETVVSTGVPTAGATLDNALGAVALTGYVLALADVLVPAASASVVTANIRDHRAHARGAYWNGLKIAVADLATSTSQTPIDSVNLAPRIELSQSKFRMAISGTYAGAIGNVLTLYATDNGTTFATFKYVLATTEEAYSFSVDYPSTAGSHVMRWDASATASSVLRVTGSKPLSAVVEEIIRTNTSNDP